MPDPARNFQAFAGKPRELGLLGTPHSAPWRPAYVAKVNEGTAGDLNLIGWTGDYGDPDNFVGTFFKRWPAQFGFQNHEIFNSSRRRRTRRTSRSASKLYKKANEMIMKYLPGVPYAHATRRSALRSACTSYDRRLPSAGSGSSTQRSGDLDERAQPADDE